MSDSPNSVAAADAAGGNFAKAFLPGLILGLVMGLFIGAWIPPFFGEKPDLIQSDRTGTPTIPREGDDPRNAQPGEQGQETPSGGDTHTTPG